MDIKMAGRSEAQKRIDRYFPMSSPIAYQSGLSLAFKSTNAGLFLYQILYWSGKEWDKDGWIKKSTKEFKTETGLTKYQQDTATTILKKNDIIETKVFGVPATRHVRVKFEILENHLTSLLKTNKLEGSIPSNNSADKQQTITKTTQKTTNRPQVIKYPELQPQLDAFIEMRKKLKRPMTDKAVELTVKKLRKLYPDNLENQKGCLDQSVENSWQGVFPLKETESDQSWF